MPYSIRLLTPGARERTGADRGVGDRNGTASARAVRFITSPNEPVTGDPS
jgi:hypothetical protein